MNRQRIDRPSLRVEDVEAASGDEFRAGCHGGRVEAFIA
jgi:hypothetical protein